MDSQNHRKEEKTFLQENGVNLMIRVHDTGIGMAITDQLVQLMGGETVVESLKDKGSGFHRVFAAASGRRKAVSKRKRQQRIGNRMRITRSAAAGSCWAEVYFDGIGWLPVDVTPGYYYDAVKLQQMVATPDMVHKTLAEDHNLMDAEQITDTGNDMDTAVAEVAELLRSLFLWKKTVLKENL
ncbi:MAG: hypothetical protein ACLTAX_12775 [Waltera sp.]